MCIGLTKEHKPRSGQRGGRVGWRSRAGRRGSYLKEAFWNRLGSEEFRPSLRVVLCPTRKAL